jgi:hypothetical protein
MPIETLLVDGKRYLYFYCYDAAAKQKESLHRTGQRRGFQEEGPHAREEISLRPGHNQEASRSPE